MPTEQQVRDIKRRHSTRLLALPGVCGVGIEKDERGDFLLAIHLDSSGQPTNSEIPSSIEGIPVREIASGPFVKQ